MPQRPIQARDAVARQQARDVVAAMRIRDAVPADLARIVDVINNAYKPRDWHIFEQLRTSIDSYPQELERRRSYGIVAELDGEIVAHVCLHTYEREAEFGLLATLPEVQGRGIAAAMIAECERRAREAGCDVMKLDAVFEVGMQPYYESLGYVLERSEPSTEWGARKVVWTHIFMEKALS
jgi:predicted N-acetyltransferase YhbS